MSNVIVKENETLDSALRRFKRSCAKAGIQQEIRKREHYEILSSGLQQNLPLRKGCGYFYVDEGAFWYGCISSGFGIYHLQYAGLAGGIHLYVVLQQEADQPGICKEPVLPDLWFWGGHRLFSALPVADGFVPAVFNRGGYGNCV